MIELKHTSTALLIAFVSMVSNSVDAGSQSTMQPSTSKPVPKILSLKATEENGEWIINGKKLPIVKTSLTSENILTIENASSSSSLNLVIPALSYSAIAKNGFLFTPPLTVNENDSGSKVIWLEPLSRLTIAFRNDLADTPLQAIVAVTKNSKKVLAIFGPDQAGKFKLTETVSTQTTTDYSTFGFIKKNVIWPKGYPIQDLSASSGTVLIGNRIFSTRTISKNQHVEFSDPVFVLNQNSAIGGSKFWTKELYLHSGEKVEFLTAGKTTVIGAK